MPLVWWSYDQQCTGFRIDYFEHWVCPFCNNTCGKDNYPQAIFVCRISMSLPKFKRNKSNLKDRNVIFWWDKNQHYLVTPNSCHPTLTLVSLLWLRTKHQLVMSKVLASGFQISRPTQGSVWACACECVVEGRRGTQKRWQQCEWTLPGSFRMPLGANTH